MKATWFIPLLALLLGGCRPPASGPLLLGRGVPFVLRAPEAGPRLFTTQEVRFRMPDGSEELFVTSLENDGDHLSVVCSTPMGQTLFTLQLRQGVVKTDARVPLPRALDLRLLPALIQLSDWPLEDLRKGLGPGTTLEEEGQVRTLRRGERIILTVRREGTRRTIFEIPSASVSAVITTLED